MSNSHKDSVENDLFLMVKANLVDVRMREDGEWIYSPSEYSRTLTPEQLNYILENLDDYQGSNHDDLRS
jgi:hypothetical protein